LLKGGTIGEKMGKGVDGGQIEKSVSEKLYLGRFLKIKNTKEKSLVRLRPD